MRVALLFRSLAAGRVGLKTLEMGAETAKAVAEAVRG
jgi:hypothetical protein